MTWWPTLIVGWPAVILALGLAGTGIARSKPILNVAAAVVLAPLSFYLGGTPGLFPYGFMIPMILLAAGIAVHYRKPVLAWTALAPVVALLGWIFVIAIRN